jgi:hypothetical protein
MLYIPAPGVTLITCAMALMQTECILIVQMQAVGKVCEATMIWRLMSFSRVIKFPPSNLSAAVCGSRTDRASDFLPSGRTMSGPTTLSRIARMKARNTGC